MTTDPLRARFEAAAPRLDVDGDRIVRLGRRRRALGRSGGVLGSLALVVAVLLVVRPGGGTTPVASTPPPEPAADVSLWLSATEVPTGPATLVAALVAHAETDAVFGVGAEVERWDGRGWRPHRLVALCLAEWRCVGELVADGEGFAVNDIGLSATPGRPGPAQSFSTDGLEEGWYRLVQDAALAGAPARAVFRVTDGAAPTAPLPPRDGVSLVVEPVLVPPAGGRADLAVVVPPDAEGTLTFEDVAAAEQALADTAAVERWDGTGWVAVGEVEVPDLGTDDPEAAPDPARTTVTLPSLPEGAYRVVRAGPDGDAFGTFWVTGRAPDLPGADRSGPGDPTPVDDPPAGDPERPPADPARFGLDDLAGTALEPTACRERPEVCALSAWLYEVLAIAGYPSTGGDHDTWREATDAVDLGDGALVGLVLTTAEQSGTGEAVLVPDRLEEVGIVQLEVGTQEPDGLPGARLSCGGLVLTASARGGTAEQLAEVAARLALAVEECPIDLAGLAARYPELDLGSP